METISTNYRKKSMSCKVGGAANALSLCKDNSKLVVAGRSLLKLFSIDENNGKFVEMKNLHVGRRQGLNMSSSDVAWCPNDENIIATAATNGAVVAWDLTATTRHKQLIVFSEHRRTVHKVSFHPSEASRLISGSQDGTMKMFDLRKKECSHTFNSRADGVRSVQFSPYNHFQFAASIDNGNVQIWDYRRINTFILEFIAHKGSVYTLCWHSDSDEKNTIATGGRDNIVKVWDVSQTREIEKSNIPTTSSVASVCWRPHRKDQLATASMMLDSSINVWDLRRKYVPFAYFDEHRDIPTGIEWKNNDPSTLFSCSKDGVLFLHNIREAVRPGDGTQTSGFDISSLGYICTAEECTNYNMHRSQSPTGYPRLTGIFGGWKGSGGLQLNDLDVISSSGHSTPTVASYKFSRFLNAQSFLTIFDGTLNTPTPCNDFDDYLQPSQVVVESIFMKGFIHVAKNYILDGSTKDHSFRELCKHNSEIALQAGKPNASRAWLLLSNFYGSAGEVPTASSKICNAAATPIPRTFSDVASERNKRRDADSKRTSIISRLDESNNSQIVYPTASGAESEIQSDEGRVEIEDYLTDIARGRHSEPDFYYSDDEAILTSGYDGATSEADLLTDHEWAAMRVPSEAFVQKENIDIESIANFGHVDAPSGVTNQTPAKRTVFTPHGGRWHATSVATRADSSSSPSPNGEAELFSEKDLDVKPSNWPDPLPKIRDTTTCQQLQWFAEQNDVQTPVSMMLVLSSSSIACNLSLDETDVEHWQSSYLNLLAKHQLWTQHSQVVKLSKVPSIKAISASSTVHASCRICQRRMPNTNIWSCDRRSDEEHKNKPVLCFLCNLTVKGLYTYCQGCCFGGHFKCVKIWQQRQNAKSNCRAHCV